MRISSNLVLGLLAIALLSARFSAIAQQKPEDLARQAAESWLQLTDSGKYAESWDEAAQLFKNAVPKPQWTVQIKTVRGPLGKLQSRKLKAATYTKTLPGAPDGEIVVIQYETNFENKASSNETLSPLLEKDGKWRVSGYFIK